MLKSQQQIPDLPYELEQDIFELTTRAHPESAVTLASVSRTTQLWVEAVIYHTVVLNSTMERTELFIKTIETRPPDFFAKRVKRLYLSAHVSFAQVQRILAVCTGVERLACWASSPCKYTEAFLQLLPPTNLRRLSLRAELLDRLTCPNKFSHPSFAALTHLDIVNPPQFPVDWTGLHSLRELRHLSFGDLHGWHFYMIPAFRDILLNCASLLALVLITDEDDMIQAINEGEGVCDDKRVVIIPCFNYPKDLSTFWRDVDREEADFWEMDRQGSAVRKSLMTR